MTTRFPHRTWQQGTYRVGSPDYVDVSTGAASSGMFSFIEQSVTDSANGDPWATGDEIGVLIYQDDSTYKIWTATWDPANYYLLMGTEEESEGSWSTGDAVTVMATPTKLTLKNAIETPRAVNIVTNATTSITLSNAHAGKILRCTSSSAVSIGIPDGLLAGMQVIVVQAGTGTVTAVRTETGTINGASAAVAVAGQYKTAYLYHLGGDDWEMIV